jgi:predicted 3-demethylubiquinone-9 3-methyltransferase (glyoxalase superfamily)
MPKITTFLTYADGRAEEAVNLYTSVFPNSKILTTSRSPNGAVMSATFELDGQTFYALNAGPPFTFAQGISLFVHCKTQQEIDSYTEKLTAGGGEQQPCGWIRDRFGVSWQIVPTILHELISDSKNPKKATAAMRAMMTMKKLDIAQLKAAYESA